MKRTDKPEELKKLWRAIWKLQRDGTGNLANAQKTLTTTVTADRDLQDSDAGATEGNDAGKKVVLTADTNGTTRIIFIAGAGEIGDVFSFSGNPLQPTAVLQVVGLEDEVLGIPDGYSGFTVENGEYAHLIKISETSYRVEGDYTLLVENIYTMANAASLVNETDATTGITFNNASMGVESSETGDAHSGNHFVRLETSGATSEYAATIDVENLEVGETYDVSLWVRQPIGAGTGVYHSEGFDAGGQIGSNIPANSNTWVEYTFTAEATDTSGGFGFYNATNVDGEQFDVDSISIIKTS